MEQLDDSNHCRRHLAECKNILHLIFRKFRSNFLVHFISNNYVFYLCDSVDQYIKLFECFCNSSEISVKGQIVVNHCPGETRVPFDPIGHSCIATDIDYNSNRNVNSPRIIVCKYYAEPAVSFVGSSDISLVERIFGI